LIKLRHRFRAGLSVVAPIAALAALVPASAAAAAGSHPALSRAAQPVAGEPILSPPLGRPAPATAVPDLAPGQASPWEALKNAPPFDPGTMLLASDGTVLVHSEPSSGGTSDWYKLTPDSAGS
jgi:hypothetical protein